MLQKVMRNLAFQVVAFVPLLVLSCRGPLSTSTNVQPNPVQTTTTKQSVFENSLGMRFAKVPGTDVLFSIWETRVQDYRSFAESQPGLDDKWRHPQHDYESRVFGVKRHHADIIQNDQHPVIEVSWVDAKKFCKWLTDKERAEGIIPPTARYRLPISAEWDVAVGIMDTVESAWESQNTSAYLWRGKWPPRGKSGNLCDVSLRRKHPGTFFGEKAIRSYNDGYPYTAPVGLSDVNSLGLYDLAGNVSEWCDDQRNGTRPGIDDDDASIVSRGGSWNAFDKEGLLASDRSAFSATLQLNFVGFRVVLETPDARRVEK
jgi:formylglycine-generating enzyme required for sulfatase activity